MMPGTEDGVLSKAGGSVERIVHIAFGGDVSADDVASWLTAIGACGVIHADDESERRYVVTVRRAGAMEYLETLLARGQTLGVLVWQLATP
jgi:hypothetical protein